jgi:uncharacterized protein
MAALRTAELVIHLGDFTELEVVTFLEGYAPLVGVHGNNDSEEVRLRFPAVQRVEIEGKTFVLMHGDVGGRTANVAARTIEGGDAVLYGHSHRPVCAWESGRLFFNPGSPTDRRWSEYRAFGTMLVDEKIEATIVPLR